MVERLGIFGVRWSDLAVTLVTFRIVTIEERCLVGCPTITISRLFWTYGYRYYEGWWWWCRMPCGIPTSDSKSNTWVNQRWFGTFSCSCRQSTSIGLSCPKIETTTGTHYRCCLWWIYFHWTWCRPVSTTSAMSINCQFVPSWHPPNESNYKLTDDHSISHPACSKERRYSDRLQVWLNDQYPLANTSTSRMTSTTHRVFNKGSHGADVSHTTRKHDEQEGLRTVNSLEIILTFSFLCSALLYSALER
jgi:hypothetical protein